ncbi:hypothetical protein Tco_0519820 [Tanacetum coccineum]
MRDNKCRLRSDPGRQIINVGDQIRVGYFSRSKIDPQGNNSVPPVHRMTARISIQDEPSISLPPREEVERLLALTTPPPSPLTPLSSPLPHIPSPPLPASPPAFVLLVLASKY